MMKNKGFTLIELLVVISIIALLSVIVLAAVNDARDRAKNTKKNRLVEEYINALELYRVNYPELEYPSEGYGSNAVCMGQSSESTCQGFLPYSSTFNDKIDDYISGPPENNTPVPFGNYDMQGLSYKCLSLSGSKCSSYQIIWYLNGANQKCIKGITPSEFTSEITKCKYIN